MYIFFWNGPYSNWASSPFTLDGVNFSCEEQHMMYTKAMFFGDTETAQKVLDAVTPGEQKALGRQVKGFDAEKWTSSCDDLIYKGLKAKFLQNPDLLKQLVSEEGIFVEASPYDRIWGIGFSEQNAMDNWPDWGENKLGKVLTKLRDELKK